MKNFIFKIKKNKNKKNSPLGIIFFLYNTNALFMLHSFKLKFGRSRYTNSYIILCIIKFNILYLF